MHYQIYTIHSPFSIQTSSQFSANGKCLKTPILHLLPSTNGNKRKHFNFRSLLLCQKGGKVEEETSIGHHPSASTSSISSVSLWINVCRRRTPFVHCWFLLQFSLPLFPPSGYRCVFLFSTSIERFFFLLLLMQLLLYGVTAANVVVLLDEKKTF